MAAIGTIASIAPPNAIAGISRTEGLPKRCGQFRAVGEAGFADCRRHDATFDRGRSRRTARANSRSKQPKRGDGLAPAVAADATIATPAAETERSAIGSRWPEQSATSSSTVPSSDAANSTAAAPSNPDATPSAAPAAIALAAADSSLEKSPGLKTAGIDSDAVACHSRRTGAGRSDRKRDFQVRKPAMERPAARIQLDRQALWETANIDRRSPPVDFDPAARIRRDDIPWELRTADDPNGRIQEMLARLARSATRS